MYAKSTLTSKAGVRRKRGVNSERNDNAPRDMLYRYSENTSVMTARRAGVKSRSGGRFGFTTESTTIERQSFVYSRIGRTIALLSYYCSFIKGHGRYSFPTNFKRNLDSSFLSGNYSHPLNGAHSSLALTRSNTPRCPFGKDTRLDMRFWVLIPLLLQVVVHVGNFGEML